MFFVSPAGFSSFCGGVLEWSTLKLSMLYLLHCRMANITTTSAHARTAFRVFHSQSASTPTTNKAGTVTNRKYSNLPVPGIRYPGIIRCSATSKLPNGGNIYRYYNYGVVRVVSTSRTPRQHCLPLLTPQRVQYNRPEGLFLVPPYNCSRLDVFTGWPHYFAAACRQCWVSDKHYVR